MRLRKITGAFLAFIAAAAMMFSGSGVFVSYAAVAPAFVYEFDHTKTAVAQLEDLLVKGEARENKIRNTTQYRLTAQQK